MQHEEGIDINAGAQNNRSGWKFYFCEKVGKLLKPLSARSQ
jgi:hypothetical protein